MPLRVRPRARETLHALLRERDLAVATPLRISLRPGPGSAPHYLFEFGAAPRADDWAGEVDGVALRLSPEAARHLEGAALDWREDLLNRGFVFVWADRREDAGSCSSCAPAALPV